MGLFIYMLMAWQQQIDYSIQARLDTGAHVLFATEQVTYRNASPGALDTLFFHLYANAYKDAHTTYARETVLMGDDKFQRSRDEERGSIDVTNVLWRDQRLMFSSESTLLAVPLPLSLMPGDSIVLSIDFTLVFPRIFSRLGYEHNHYEVVQWYPKACVFDDDGWHIDTYHALGEFYGEFATYDVRIDLPANFIVAATGDPVDDNGGALINKTTPVQSPERKVVRFSAARVHDFAWVCDPDYHIEQYEEDGVSLYVYYLKQHEKKWRNAADYARDAVRCYTEWYGSYPYHTLSIVESHMPGGMEYPMLVLVGGGQDNFTRLFETVLVHELAHQWFYAVLANNEIEEAWLDEGFTSHAEMRYLDEKYGTRGWLLDVPFLEPLSRRYYHQFIYYLVQTNQLERPVLTPAYDFVREPIGYENSAYSKPALFLQYLRNFLGHDTFDAIMKRYYRENQFRHVRSTDFVTVCEQESGQDLGWFFDSFLQTTRYCDWSVQSIDDGCVRIQNNGTFNLPVDVLVETDSGSRVYPIGTEDDTVVIILPSSMGRVRNVTVDPAGYAVEPDRWNNHFPRKVIVRPLFGLPSFDAYQVILLPYVWYSSHDGIKIGLYLFGSEFMDFDFVKGRHQWFAGGNYGMKSGNFYPSYNYQTPLVFERGKRIRVFLEGSNSRDRDNITIGLRSNFGMPMTSKDQIIHESALVCHQMKEYLATDSIDWELGTSVIMRNTLSVERGRWSSGCGISLAHRIMGSDWDFLRVTGEFMYRGGGPVPFRVRAFMGKIFGTAPRQERLYLSGSLRITALADIVFDQAGALSPQEHIHIPGDGNMRGYQTMHIKADHMFCVNLELLSHLPVRLFTDIGFHDDLAFDLGSRLVLGPVSLNVPFYTLTDAPWELRWSIGL
jgi:hypothetical protein